MSEKLWFITDGADFIGVHFSKVEAKMDYERFRYDPDFDSYTYYAIDIHELEDYPEEYDYALEQDVI